MPQPIKANVIFEDLSARFQSTNVVGASPSGASETVVATLTIANFNDIAALSGIRLRGWAAFTVGTSGTAATLQIKQTGTGGTAVSSSGATTVTAANLLEMSVNGFDAAPGIGVYVLTLTVANGSAASTVSKTLLEAVII
jgi:hypothetical protein